mmetsp:Transcript_8773/g.27208  ORF Transcript_8773/g.27208 Transcript_8773/m.27208 type:complete len:407 (-) Transcript_8773:217-1437(-)
MLHRDHVREDAGVGKQLFFVACCIFDTSTDCLQERWVRVLRWVHVLAHLAHKLHPLCGTHLTLPRPGRPLLLAQVLGKGEVPRDGVRHLQAAHLRVHGVEEAHLVPGRQARLAPHEAVVHLRLHPWFEVEVEELLCYRHHLVRLPLLLPRLAKGDLLGDQYVVRVLPADVCKVVLGDPEGEERAEEAVDPRLLGLVVRGAGALPAVEGVAPHLPGRAVAGPGHLDEKLLVQIRAVLAPPDCEEGLWTGTAGRVCSGQGQALEVHDLLHGVVLANDARLAEGLREPGSTALLQPFERRGHGQTIHVAVQRDARLLLDLDGRELDVGRQRLAAGLLERLAARLHQPPAGLEVLVHRAAGARRRAGGPPSDPATRQGLHVGIHELRIAHDWLGRPRGRVRHGIHGHRRL